MLNNNTNQSNPETIDKEYIDVGDTDHQDMVEIPFDDNQETINSSIIL